MNYEPEEEAWLELERKLKKLNDPVAWRKKVGNTWHYFDASTPFNLDDCEPLYLRPTK